jgi:peptidyl-tRNA hydrolase, PTH1 family
LSRRGYGKRASISRRFGSRPWPLLSPGGVGRRRKWGALGPEGQPALILGLGNPGAEYVRHRHNVGFRVVEALARAHGLAFSRNKGKAKIAEGRLKGQRVILAKPQTFMNLSGLAADRLSRAYGVPPERILVVYDDLDLPLGRLRLRPEGGAGGHKGIKSVIEHLHTPAFPRLRLGIGRPPGRMDPADYVLQPFSSDEQPLVSEMVEQAVAAVECWLDEGLVVAMERFNRPLGPAENGFQEVPR